MTYVKPQLSNITDKKEKIKVLVDFLNYCRNEYYNNSTSPISDYEYDELYDQLQDLENETDFILCNSPTITVGYEIVSGLTKVVHMFPPMLSLDKTKDITVVKKFLDGNSGLMMAKMDGLTCRISYQDGELLIAETRGDGYEGEDITHNIKVVKDVPLLVDRSGEFVVDGELIITRDNFETVKERCKDSNGKTYKNPRNLASGSVRLLDSGECAQRQVQFVAWKLVKGSSKTQFSERLEELRELGFNVVPYATVTSNSSKEELESITDLIQTTCKNCSYPIDGCVASFNDCSLMESLGYTSHHAKSQLAYKFYDDKYDTVIRSVDWTMGKTGILTPTAIFDTVEIDGTDVSRASMHNLTIMKKLKARIGASARVFKANMIIPQIDSIDDDGTADIQIPEYCPLCGAPTEIVQENDTEVLMCVNNNCRGKLLGKLSAFVSKDGMDIEGLSESTLDTFIDRGIVRTFADIFNLEIYYGILIKLEGFGQTSVNKLLEAIRNARTVKFENFLASLSIDHVGLTTAKTIAQTFDHDFDKFLYAVRTNYDFTTIKGFGTRINDSIHRWFALNDYAFSLLYKQVNIIAPEVKAPVQSNSIVSGKTFCITGTFWDKREALKTRLENLGGIPVDSVTKKTDILFVGDKAGSKLKKAQELNIIIYDENDLKKILEE